MHDRLPSVAKWLTMSQNDVLDKFMNLPNAFTDGTTKKQNRFVFVPGTRDDRVLLVAHADTVWLDNPIRLGYFNNILYSLDRNTNKQTKQADGSTRTRWGVGIGADDRAGCAIAWALRDLGHSILITSGEEQGCIGSKWIMGDKAWRKNINTTHSFIVQFDRHGHKDIVFYDKGTKAFVEYTKEQTGFTPAQGSYTDIRELCYNICGVNISVGYHDEHRPEEKLVVDQFMNTLQTAKYWLSKKVPTYPLIKEEIFDIKPKYNNNFYGKGWKDELDEDWIDTWQRKNDSGKKFVATENGLELLKDAANKSIKESYRDKQVSCKSAVCRLSMPLWMWFEAQWKCPQCKITL
jgi:hypothetical protein